MEHHHEKWQLQSDGDGGLYCGACGKRISRLTEQGGTMNITGPIESWEQVHAEIIQVIGDRTDHVYVQAGDVQTYVRDGQPDCLVGQWLAARGVPLDVLAEFDDMPSDVVEGGAASTVVRHLDGRGLLALPTAPDALRDVLYYLDSVQEYQDLGTKWGEAAQIAESQTAEAEEIAGERL